MKRFRTLGMFSAITLVLSCIFLTAATAQVKFRSEDLVVKVKGTSSLHDWEIKSSKGKVEAVLVLGPNYKITGVSGLRFTVESESLKSGHNMMDNNTYKALKTNTHENISFVLSSANITQIDANTYLLKCVGNMTIAGTTRETDLVAQCKVNSDGTFTCSGSKNIKMTDFNIKPPTAMMGTVKTGNDISIAYNLKIVK
jgi:polyisoprenoid-binding protein YceI